MEDEDRLLADDTSAEKITHADTQQSILSTMQDNMLKMAQSMESMSQAWTKIAKDKETIPKGDGKKERGAKRSLNEPSTSKAGSNKRPRYSESENESSDGDYSSGSCSDMNSESETEELIQKSGKKEKVSAEAPKGDSKKSSLMAEIERELETNDKGPEIEGQVAKNINKRWSQRMDIGILKGKIEKYPVPANCENLVAPRVNTPVWKTLDRYTKSLDIRMVNVQKTCVAAGSALASCLNDLVKSDSVDIPTLIRQVSDAVGLLGHVNYELSLKRRDSMRRALSSEYKDLCNADNSVTNMLFGEDLHKDMKNAKESKDLGFKLGKKFGFPKKKKFGQSNRDFHKGKSFKYKNKNKKTKKFRKRTMESSEED